MKSKRAYKPKCKVCTAELRTDGLCVRRCDPALACPSKRAGRVMSERKEVADVSAVL